MELAGVPMTSQRAMEVLELAKVSPEKPPAKLTWEEADRLAKAFRKVKLLAPSADGLIPIACC